MATGESVLVGETEVTAVLRGSTTAATSGGNVCVSKRGSQKKIAAAAPAVRPKTTHGQRRGGIGWRRATFGRPSIVTSPQLTSIGPPTWTVSRVRIEVGSAYVPTVRVEWPNAGCAGIVWDCCWAVRCCEAAVGAGLGAEAGTVPGGGAEAAPGAVARTCVGAGGAGVGVGAGAEEAFPSSGHIELVGTCDAAGALRSEDWGAGADVGAFGSARRAAVGAAWPAVPAWVGVGAAWPAAVGAARSDAC